MATGKIADDAVFGVGSSLSPGDRHLHRESVALAAMWRAAGIMEGMNEAVRRHNKNPENWTIEGLVWAAQRAQQEQKYAANVLEGNSPTDKG